MEIGDNILRLLLIIVLIFGPIVLIAKLLQWIIQFSVGGGMGRMIGGMMGQAEGKLGGGLKGWTKERQGQTRYGLKRQLGKADRQQQRISRAVGGLQDSRYERGARRVKGAIGRRISESETLSRIPGAQAIAGMSQRDQRIQQQLMAYQAEDEKKNLQNFNTQHMQALAHSRGDVQGAVNYLQERGIDANANDVQGTRQALSGIGELQKLQNGNSSTWQAVGDLAASRGELLGNSGQTDANGRAVQDGFAADFQQIADRSGSDAVRAAAQGIGVSWGIQARSQGQFSHNLQRLPTFSHASVSDLRAIMNQATAAAAAGRLTQGSAAYDPGLAEQLTRHFAQAEVAMQNNDAAYNQDVRGIINEGLRNIGAGIVSSSPTQAGNAAADFRLSVQNEAQRLRDSGVSIGTSVGK